ncbi:phosphatase PAP2 family protein [Daejeonella oryzae]|uniref:phosphatase PAP2 family protein n=1 Tax=Daejeonella oryzae TaxID=1122943 RepID=UPI00047A92C2|nr:phosphatase PAP2 family protein [Daejeonella oryzae]
MKFNLPLLLSFVLLSLPGFAQKKDSPYKTTLKIDGPAIAAGIGMSYLGLTLIQNIEPLTDAELAAKSSSDVFFIDRHTAGDFSRRADKDSYIPFYGSFAAVPIAALLNKNQRSHMGQVMVLFVETMGLTGSLYTMTAGTIRRSRPLVYSTNVSDGSRKSKDAQRSFFAGHTAATASATFFAAKVFNDFNPDSKARPYVWAAGAAVPAVVGYLRYKAGKHFLTDNLLGYAIGAGAGILVPQLHKKSNKREIAVQPIGGVDFQGLSLTYKPGK